MSILLSKEDYLNGQVLLFNKEKDWTSFDLVNKARNLIRKRFDIKKIKVGHAGTLDPLAEGLMIVCSGKQTKKIDQYQGLDKTYVTTIKLGQSTLSFDTETEVDVEKSIDHIDLELVKVAVGQYIGKQEQVPPMFSAVNVNGKRAYQLAREGKQVDLKKKNIEIYQIEILNYNAPFLSLEINCSKGTYIRSLARDIGISLNTVAHLVDLKRTKIGSFSIDQAISIKEFENLLFIKQ